MDPVMTPPPRMVEQWTRVEGHQVIGSSSQVASFCKCGESQKEPTIGVDWGREHLENAWPILVPRLQAETLEQWRSRLIAEVDAAAIAAAVEDEFNDRLIEVAEGVEIAPTDQLHMAGHDLLAVLTHQLAGRPFNQM
jgi:hypothetical protein